MFMFEFLSQNSPKKDKKQKKKSIPTREFSIIIVTLTRHTPGLVDQLQDSPFVNI